jgi:hypothetical protein
MEGHFVVRRSNATKILEESWSKKKVRIPCQESRDKKPRYPVRAHESYDEVQDSDFRF